MSRQVRSVDLLKVVNSNNITTSLVEVPCSAEQSGFKKQSPKPGWVERILYNVRKNKKVGGVLFYLQLGQGFLEDALGYDILANALAEHHERKEG
jgi:hypothetical protein